MTAWYVTVFDRYSITVEVWADTKEGARREALKLHPHGRIGEIEKVRGSVSS